jgi:hypothetical protein
MVSEHIPYVTWEIPVCQLVFRYILLAQIISLICEKSLCTAER